ncbi:MAG TPA: PKD domain-containing protein [Pyrinomonadaceae bacterium]|nr:PKD domain-containing protein [Pyrinomonadaceae bacterium]
MRLARRASALMLTLLLCAAASAQTLRPADDPRNTAPTVGTGGSPGGPTGLFTIYDGQTLRKGEFTFSFAYSNYDRDPGNVDITEVPVSFQVGLSDHLELFYNTDAYRGVKVNNPAHLSSFYLPNSQLFTRANVGTGLGPLILQSGPAIVTAPIRVSGSTQLTTFGPLFRPTGNQPFVQFPFIGGTGPNFGLTGNNIAPPFVSTLGAPTGGGGGNFGAASNFPGYGSIYGSILPGIVLTTRTIPANLTFNILNVPDLFTAAPSYLPDAPFINRLYGESSFNTHTFGAKIRFTDPENPLGVGIVPLYRWYWDNADDFQGFNQLQRGSSPGGSIGDFGLIGFIDGRLSKHVNLSSNIGYILNSNPKSEAMGDAILLDRPDELIAGIGVDFPVNETFQPIFELKSVRYVGGRTPNAFPNHPIDFLGGVRIFPARWLGFSAWYRAHLNQQGDRLFGDQNYPAGFRQSEDPHGFGFQFFIGRRNERAPTELPNQAPTVTVTSSTSRVTLPANCPPDQMADPGCTPTSTSVQLTANATDPDGDTLLYTWTTTGGRVTGDGPNVTWDLTGVQPGTYTANVEVDDGCGCIAYSSATVVVDTCGCVATPTPTPIIEESPTPTPTPPVIAAPTPFQFDTYGNIPRNDVKARLDNFANALQENPGAQGYIIAYGGRRGVAGEAQRRADFARDYLVNTRGIDAGRLVTIDGGFREEATTELWIVPSGATPPTASPNVDPSEVQTTRPRTTRRRRGRTRRDDDE